MAISSYQIRECSHCSLRFPIIDAEFQTTRCPVCLGRTRVISTYKLARGYEKDDAPNPRVKRKPILGLLDNIRSGLNVGAIFRTAEGLGLKHLYLCGITPTPENPGVLKTGLGAQDYLSWSSHRNGVRLLQPIKAEGAGIIVLENKIDALSIDDFKGKDLFRFTKLVLVVGNEVTGVDPAIIDLADSCVNIPMPGKKQSLNVSVAFAIAAYLITTAYEPLKIRSNPRRSSRN